MTKNMIFRSIPWSFKFALRYAPWLFTLSTVIAFILALSPTLQVFLINQAVHHVELKNDSAYWLWALILGGFIAVYLVLSRAVYSFQRMVLAKLAGEANAQISRVLQNLPPHQIRDARIQKTIRGAREAAQNQGPQYQAVAVTHSLLTLLTIVMLFGAIGTISLPAAFCVLGCMFPMLMAMSMMGKREYSASGDIYENRRYEHYYLDQLINTSTAHELAVMQAGSFFGDRAIDRRRKAKSKELGLEINRAYINGISGIVCALLLMDTIYFLVQSGAPAGLIVGGIVGTLTGMAETQIVGYSMGRIASNASDIARYRELIDHHGEALNESAGNKDQEPSRSLESIHVHDLGFTYPGNAHQSLTNISLNIVKGQIVAFVGVSGSGKTTLINNILGLLTPQTGSVVYSFSDSTQERITHRESLDFTRYVSVLTQDFGRYEITIRESLTLGIAYVPSAEQLWQALRLAEADSFVQDLPDGLDTQLGEQWDGVGLSGGQWQRLALARLILRNADVWILDEPTSAVDAEAEEEIFSTLSRLHEDHMTVLVSHRAWTLKNIDTIYVIDQGKVVESGSYDELMKSGRKFQEIFSSQSSENNSPEVEVK